LKIQAINGFKDILPDSIGRWQYIEQRARDIFARFGMQEIRMPILEKTELFVRSIGEATDVVEKEMYTFADKGITMRPEATASIMRAFIEHGLHVQQPVQRLYTIGPMFRHERPQKGRLRQFHQLDAEIIGAVEPQSDAELIAMGQMLLDELGLQVSLELNSLGCPVCRPPFKVQLIAFLEQKADGLCDDCKRRTHTNPLRVLDCKKPACRTLVQEAPSLLDSLCPECDTHFQEVRKALENLASPFKSTASWCAALIITPAPPLNSLPPISEPRRPWERGPVRWPDRTTGRTIAFRHRFCHGHRAHYPADGAAECTRITRRRHGYIRGRSWRHTLTPCSQLAHIPAQTGSKSGH
jgi:histidyl-tRNA synthetase